MLAEDIRKIIEFIVGIIVTLIPVIISLKLLPKTQKQAEKSIEEIDAKADVLNAQVSETLVKSAGELIEKYNGMIELLRKEYDERVEFVECRIDDLNKKLLAEVEKRILLETRLLEETKNREALEVTIEKLKKGIQILTGQLKELGVSPQWTQE